jgi:hypothetical protein
MTKKRYAMLRTASIHIDHRIDQDITDEEFDQGYHYCWDWDGLFIGPDSMEWESCTCHPLKREEIPE